MAPAPELTGPLDALRGPAQDPGDGPRDARAFYSKAFVDELAAGVDYVAVNPEDGGGPMCATRWTPPSCSTTSSSSARG